MGLFVEYSCGCIGIPIEEQRTASDAKRNAVIVDHCDRDRDELPDLNWFLRDMSEKTFEEISVQEEAEFHREIARQLYYGRAFEQVRDMLGVNTLEAKLKQLNKNFEILKQMIESTK